MSTTFAVERRKRPKLHLSFGEAPKPSVTMPRAPVPAHKHKSKASRALSAIEIDGVTYSVRAGFLAQCIVTDTKLSLQARTLGAYVASTAVLRVSDNVLGFKLVLGKFTLDYVSGRLGFNVTAALYELIAARILRLEANPYGGQSLRIRSGFVIRQLKAEREWRAAKGRG